MVATPGSEADTEGAQEPLGYMRPMCHLPYNARNVSHLCVVGSTERPEFWHSALSKPSVGVTSNSITISVTQADKHRHTRTHTAQGQCALNHEPRLLCAVSQEGVWRLQGY